MRLTVVLRPFRASDQKPWKKLMIQFKSIKRLGETPEEEIVKLVGKSKAEKVVAYFKNS